MATAGKTVIKVEKDNTEEVLRAVKRQIELALEAIGGEMERHAKENCPVDTGRLRNSITFATSKMQSPANTDKPTDTKSDPQDAEPADYEMHGTPEENTVVVGTNVEYAPEQEYYGRKKHFLRNSVTMHNDDYKKIAEAALKS